MNRRTRVVACHGLTETDLSALQIFLNFSLHSTRDAWSLGTLGEADLLLQPLGEPLPVLAMPVTIVWVGEMQAGTPAGSHYALARPLQLDQVLALLLRIERQEDAGFADVVAVSGPGHAVADGSPTQPLPRPKPRAEAEAQRAAALPSVPPVEAGLTFHLNRWPSARSLAAHRYLPRLASLLSTRHLSVFELSRLSNVAPEECSAFLEDMASEGILDTQFPSELPSEFDSGPATEAGPQSAPVPFQAAGAPADAGLVSQLRSLLRFS